MMDVYAMDKNFQTLDIFDEYKTLVWTERYSSAGESVFEIPDSLRARKVVREGNILSIPVSKDAVLIENFSAKDKVLSVKGPMLSDFLRQRMVKRSWDNKYGAVPTQHNPVDIPNALVKQFAQDPEGIAGSGLLTGALNGPYELIPNLQLATPDVQDMSPYPDEVILSISNGNLYDAVKAVSDAYGLGFRLYPKNIVEDSYDLVFETYTGKNRTSLQDVNPVVRFQTALDSLTNTEELRSISGYKNVAWAYATNIVSTYFLVGYAFADAAAQRSVGFDRRTLLVQVDDIQPDDVNLTTSDGRAAFVALLSKRAQNALINNNYVRMVNGEIVPQNGYKYNVHYGLGDIIELTVESGDSSIARVSEYVFTEDENGSSSYPTLSSIT